jgi:transcription elongation factor GreB
VSRYRPPTAPSSKYITPEGVRRLRGELDRLWHEERPRVTAAVAEAAAQGDRSENAEYIYGKRRLAEIDRRVRFLRKRLDGMVVIDPEAGGARRDPQRVFFGAWVRLSSSSATDAAARWLRLVGPDEFDMASNYLSMDSPLGRSLLGKRLDDEVTLQLPGGEQTFLIEAICYARPADA